MVPVVAEFPEDGGFGESGGFFEFELEPGGVFGAVGGPAGLFVAIDGFPWVVLVADLGGGGGEFDFEGVFGWVAEGGFGFFFGGAFYLFDEIGAGVGGEVGFVEISGGPEEAAGDEVEVAGVFDGEGVVADGGGEGGGALFGVGPGDDGGGFDVFVAAFVFLDAEGEGFGVEEVDVVVEFFFAGDPVFEGGIDGVVFVGEFDGDGFLGAVGGGLEAEVFEPEVVALAEGVHGAVEVDGGDGFVGVEDVFEDVGVFVRGGAFVVDDDVVAFGPVGVFEDGEGRVGGFVASPDDIDADVGTFLDAFVEGFVLADVVVTAATGDEEGFEGAGFLGWVLFGLGEEDGGEGEGGE